MKLVCLSLFSSQSCLTVQSHGLQKVRLSCPPSPEDAPTNVHRVSNAIQPSHHLPSSFLFAFTLASRIFPISQLFTSGGQRIVASASESVSPMNNQD